MRDSLTTYLNDHLAGADLAIRLLEGLRKNDRVALSEFANELLAEVRSDRRVLEQLIQRVGATAQLKRVAGRLSGLISRMKLRSGTTMFGAFETLELLEIGIHGKSRLWRALETIEADEPALHGTRFGLLADRAIEQQNRVEQRRLELADEALRSKQASQA